MKHWPFYDAHVTCGEEFEQAWWAWLAPVPHHPIRNMPIAGIWFKQWETEVIWRFISHIWVMGWDDLKDSFIWAAIRALRCGLSVVRASHGNWKSLANELAKREAGRGCITSYNLDLDYYIVTSAFCHFSHLSSSSSAPTSH